MQKVGAARICAGPGGSLTANSSMRSCWTQGQFDAGETPQALRLKLEKELSLFMRLFLVRERRLAPWMAW